VRVVRSRTTELVIRRRRRRPFPQVLHLPTAAEIPHRDVELPVRPEGQHASVVIAASRLGRVVLARRLGSAVVLEGQQLEQVAVVLEL
jgi:hypothetical protein